MTSIPVSPNGAASCSTEPSEKTSPTAPPPGKKSVSVMCMSDELCQVYNALMTALSLLREGNQVAIFFGSKGVRAVDKKRISSLSCLPDEPGMQEKILAKMDELNLPLAEDLLFFFLAEKGRAFACPLNTQLFGITEADLYDGVRMGDPSTYYREVVMKADMNLTF